MKDDELGYNWFERLVMWGFGRFDLTSVYFGQVID